MVLRHLQVANRLTEKLRKKRDQERTSNITECHNGLKTFPSTKRRDAGVRVKGIDNLLIRLSKCCNPVPGDEIVGFITKGRGVSVHRADCPNVDSKMRRQSV